MSDFGGRGKLRQAAVAPPKIVIISEHYSFVIFEYYNAIEHYSLVVIEYYNVILSERYGPVIFEY